MKNLILKTILFILISCALALAQEKGIPDYDDQDRRDPFAALVDENGHFMLEVKPAHSFGELELSGILWDPQGKSSALISGQMLKEGDAICGFTVKAITKESVVFLREGREYTLRITLE